MRFVLTCQRVYYKIRIELRHEKEIFSIEEFKIGTYIKKRREELQISQEELCEGLCAVSTLSRIENNQQDPSRRLTINLLERLGLPKDRFVAFWGQKDLAIGALMRDIPDHLIRHRRASKEDRPRIAQQIREELAKLEAVSDSDDRSMQQFLLVQKTQLDGQEGLCGAEERLPAQLEAIRLTCPKFDPKDCLRGRYNMSEFRLINQIALTYSDVGQRKQAIGIYYQLLNNLEKNCRELDGYPSMFCLIAHNYSIVLGGERRYVESIEIAEQGRKTCTFYGKYQFLPGFLAIQAESNYFLGKEMESRELYLQAYYIYKAFGDGLNLERMRQEMKERLDIDMPGLTEYN